MMVVAIFFGSNERKEEEDGVFNDVCGCAKSRERARAKGSGARVVAGGYLTNEEWCGEWVFPFSSTNGSATCKN